MEWNYWSIWSILWYPLPALMTPLQALVTPLSKIPFNNEGAANNGRIPPSFLSWTPFPKIRFTNEEATGCVNEECRVAINEAAIGVIKAGTTPHLVFFITCFTISVDHQQISIF